MGLGSWAVFKHKAKHRERSRRVFAYAVGYMQEQGDTDLGVTNQLKRH